MDCPRDAVRSRRLHEVVFGRALSSYHCQLTGDDQTITNVLWHLVGALDEIFTPSGRIVGSRPVFDLARDLAIRHRTESDDTASLVTVAGYHFTDRSAFLTDDLVNVEGPNSGAGRISGLDLCVLARTTNTFPGTRPVDRAILGEMLSSQGPFIGSHRRPKRIDDLASVHNR
jgi:hypothetical protein